MKDEKKDKLLEENLRKFKYRVGYKINETARYRPLVSQDEQFDNLPVELYNTDDGQAVPQSPAFTNEAGDQEDAPIPGGGAQPPAPSNDLPVDMNAPPAAGAPAGEVPPPEGGGELPAEVSASGKETPADIDGQGGMNDPMGEPLNGPMGGGMGMNPGQQVDNIQNEIIKHNTAAMQSIHDKLKGLDSTVVALNAKLDSLNADVEEVREPTNSEKLMSKTNVSYPYYFNLNDFWSGNWFNQKREEEHEKGMRELPDGTFIADFDDLPQQSKNDVQNSFNNFD
jgi:hypothetical protein